MQLILWINNNSAAALARRIGVTTSAVLQWVNGERPVPIPRCVQIERATRGKVTRMDLCPEWREIWPELAAMERAARAGRAVRRVSKHSAAGRYWPRQPRPTAARFPKRTRMSDLLIGSVVATPRVGYPRLKELRL